jgi:hypothetical protein
MPPPLFIRENILPGDILHVRGRGKYSAKICAVIGSVGAHDALFLNRSQVGESTALPPFAHRTEIDVYEARMRAGHCRVSVLRIPGLTSADRHAIAEAWVEHVRGDFYDFSGIVKLWLKERGRRLPDARERERILGWEWAHWCTEGVRTACIKGSRFRTDGTIDPLAKENPTPRTVENRVREGLLSDVSLRCLTEAGLRCRLLIPGVC